MFHITLKKGDINMIATIKLKNGDSYLITNVECVQKFKGVIVITYLDDGKLPVQVVQFPDDGSVQITVTL